MKIVYVHNYLHVTLNINISNGSCYPSKKANKEANYIHVNSDRVMLATVLL